MTRPLPSGTVRKDSDAVAALAAKLDHLRIEMVVAHNFASDKAHKMRTKDCKELSPDHWNADLYNIVNEIAALEYGRTDA